MVCHRCVLCTRQFAHTRFEPSGWTGNPEIGYAKSIMDYIFRWIQMRFLSGTQLDLFAGLGPHASPVIAVEGTVTAPENTVSLSSNPAGETGAEPRDPHAPFPTMSSALASFADAADVTPQAILQREARERGGYQALSDQDIFDNGADSKHDSPRSMMEDRTPPQHGIAPEAAPRGGQSANGSQQPGNAFQDRGIYHAADAMKSMYDMGDAPVVSATCGAIMTRSGSCYRCMSCGNTSGCS